MLIVPYVLVVATGVIFCFGSQLCRHVATLLEQPIHSDLLRAPVDADWTQLRFLLNIFFPVRCKVCRSEGTAVWTDPDSYVLCWYKRDARDGAASALHHHCN